MRVVLDATPLLGHLTGVGHYVNELLAHLPAVSAVAGQELELRVTAFTHHGHDRLPGLIPDGVSVTSRAVPVHALHWVWERSELLPGEWLGGRADIFHGTNFVLPPLRKAAGVVTVHDLSFVRFPETVSAASLRYQRLVPRSIARAQVVCTQTEAMRDELADYYRIEPERIHVTNPGVDADWFAIARPSPAELAELGLPERYLLAVGTLEPRKNLAELLRAYNQLRRSDDQTPPLVLVGATGWGPALDLQALPAGSVITTGYLDNADLRRAVAGASCLAFPSIYEGFGIPPVEALACGVAVVATDLPVTREVLGDAARLVPAGDTDALAEALRIELVADAAAGADHLQRVAARRKQARRWTWRQCAEQTFAAYRAARSD